VEIRFCLTVVVAAAKDREGFVGYLKEIPVVSSQGETLIELKENLLDVLKLFCEG
jgi:predicted RNase H-like HicB family nuclease